MEFLSELLDWVRQLHSDEGIRSLIAWGGLTVLVAIVFAETGLLAGFFLPGDSLLVTAGVVCAGAFPGLPPLNIWLTNLLLVLAAVIGDQVGYTLGRRAGRAIYSRPDSRFFKKKYLYEAQELYATKGGSSLIIARFVPVMRTFVPFIAGVAHMPYRSFVFYNVAGGVLWVTSLLWIGYFLGQSPLAEQIHHVILLVIFVSVLPLAWEVWKRVRKSPPAIHHPVAPEADAVKAPAPDGPR
jgi:membrane-associated protein